MQSVMRSIVNEELAVSLFRPLKITTNLLVLSVILLAVSSNFQSVFSNDFMLSEVKQTVVQTERLFMIDQTTKLPV